MRIQYEFKNINIIGDWGHRHTILFGSSNKDVFYKELICSHYTNLDAFWNIITNEIFWATHVRFSNDAQEYKQGELQIGKIIGKSKVRKENYYGICFCSNGDLLSQWREYGKVGVSIEMDFSRAALFTILKNQIAPTSVSDKLQFALPTSVLYAGKKDGKQMFYNDNVSISISDFINEYNNRSYDYLNDDQMLNLIPYIKNSAFEEEKESRLLFAIQDQDCEADYVHYHIVDNYQKPYFKVVYGNNKENQKECTYVIVEEKVNRSIESAISSAVNQFNSDFSANVIISCETVHENKIYISAGKNQRELFERIERACEILTQKPKIWCDGHWPIRSIKVGPTLDKELIKESIDHYCKSHYWLKYVKVDATDTPYREKRNK